MKFPIVEPSLLPFLIPLGPKYLPHHPVLNYPYFYDTYWILIVGIYSFRNSTATFHKLRGRDNVEK